jgi:hypothetical protein
MPLPPPAPAPAQPHRARRTRGGGIGLPAAALALLLAAFCHSASAKPLTLVQSAPLTNTDPQARAPRHACATSRTRARRTPERAAHRH